MNRNQLKIIACIAMLIDHMGIVFFPHIPAFRLIGRLAMPVFAYFIGEGCCYTKNKKAYFLRVFLLGLGCQAVYPAEALINGGDGFYLNILLTFSVSILLSAGFDYVAEKTDNVTVHRLMPAAALVVAFAFERLTAFLSGWIFSAELTFDYGFTGMCLPLFLIPGKSKREKLVSFSVGMVLFCLVNYAGAPEHIFCALGSIPLLLLYNGKGGDKRLKYFFYAFYPLHLAVLYITDYFI